MINEIIEYLEIPTPIVIITAILLVVFCYWRITVLIDEIGDEVKKFNN